MDPAFNIKDDDVKINLDLENDVEEKLHENDSVELIDRKMNVSSCQLNNLKVYDDNEQKTNNYISEVPTIRFRDTILTKKFGTSPYDSDR